MMSFDFTINYGKDQIRRTVWSWLKKKYLAKAFQLLKAFLLFSITQPKSEFSILSHNILFTSGIIEAFLSGHHLPIFAYLYTKNRNNKP